MTNATDHEPSFQLSGGGLVYRIQQRIRGPGAGDYPIRGQFLLSLVVLWLPLPLALAEFSIGDLLQRMVDSLV